MPRLTAFEKMRANRQRRENAAILREVCRPDAWLPDPIVEMWEKARREVEAENAARPGITTEPADTGRSPNCPEEPQAEVDERPKWWRPGWKWKR